MAQIEPAAGAGHPACQPLEFPDEIGTRGPQGRNQAEHDARHQRDERGEAEHGPVHDAEIEITWPQSLRAIGPHHRLRPPCEQQTHEAADTRQQHAFREELPQESATTGAEGLADCHLPLARRRPRQHQIRDIRAANEKDKAHGRHQEADRRHRVPALRIIHKV